MKSIQECEESKSDKIIILKENKSTMRFLNPNQDSILIIEVDGCVISDCETPRCDYALVPSQDTEIYLELKGSDIKHAVEQIETSIRLLSENAKFIKKLCFVVSSRVPKQTTSIQKIQAKFKKNFNATFRVKNIKDEYDLSKL